MEPRIAVAIDRNTIKIRVNDHKIDLPVYPIYPDDCPIATSYQLDLIVDDILIDRYRIAGSRITILQGGD